MIEPSRVCSARARVLGCVLAVVLLLAVMLPAGVPAASAVVMTAEDYYVDAASGSDTTGDGSEAHPWQTITYAESHSDALDTIWVQPGTYQAPNETFPINFEGQSLVSVSGPATTIIQGTNAGQLLDFTGWTDGDTLDGFIIRQGGTTTVEAVHFNVSAATSAPNQPLVVNCDFVDNRGGTDGALRVDVAGSSALAFEDNTVDRCAATQGGGINAFLYGSLTITGNVFSNNSTTWGAGGALSVFSMASASATVDSNVFEGNTSRPDAIGIGGAIYWAGVAEATHVIRDNLFAENEALHGGALYINGMTVLLEGNDGTMNLATGQGGFAQLHDADVVARNNYLSGNVANTYGAVWGLTPTVSLTETCDTVVGSSGDQALNAVFGSAVSVTDCIYWNPGATKELELDRSDPGTQPATIAVSYTCSSDDAATLAGNGCVVGAGMAYAAPVWDAALGGEPCLAPRSALVDAGRTDVAPPIDFYGTARPLDGNGDGTAVADIGCYEAAAVPPLAPPVLTPVYRFYNFTNNTHFYTDSASERDMVIAKWPNVYKYEGEAYYLNAANNTTRLTRLYNRASGSHFYTASAGEAADALAKWPNVFLLDGLTYAVNPGPVANSIPVFRFYNLTNGSHFFTASESERNDVIAKYPKIYSYEGPAFWLGQ